ncbi:NtaA/DmoA family FMN-dependent monooxygenase [Burkholderia sp. Ac-20379]|uniref:NtaA/DmoA family FMN-dependent monooxygenase n=1 Tax=Burkholderia sp. Ac-20379 TaxID=2703900 RepID=UPI001F11BF82|nr:NtaA/DmoA family FMN-dependent monooxygenase [Burkholderia sp. Ac-20379]
MNHPRPRPRQLHLNANVIPGGRHTAGWRTQSPPPRADDIAHLIEIAQLAELGTFDAIFFADQASLDPSAPERPWNAFDPVVALAAIARETQRIGLVATASTTFEHPYTIARRFASLDHVSGGRAAWNIVTTHHAGVAGNYGLEALPAHADRYARAEEFVEVVEKLWRSWDAEAIVADAETGRYLDMARVHRIDHAGPAFSVRGPLNVPRTPQGEPVRFQAGDSDASRALGARFADALFTVQRTFDGACAFRRDIHERAARAGRDPSRLRVLPGLLTVIGATEEDAWRRKRDLDGRLDIEAERVKLANLFGVAPERLPLDAPIAADVLTEMLAGWNRPQTRGFAENLLREALAKRWTPRDAIARNPGGHRQLVGTPEQIADDIVAWFEGGAADGFNLNFDVYPASLQAFVDEVVPLLRRRGVFREAYAGATLRSHLGLD